jgi:hypothetical protein
MKTITIVSIILGLIVLGIFTYYQTYQKKQSYILDQSLSTYETPPEFRFLLRQRLGDPCSSLRLSERTLCVDPSEELVYATSLPEKEVCPLLRKSMENWPVFMDSSIDEATEFDCFYAKDKAVAVTFNIEEIKKAWVNFTPDDFVEPLKMIIPTDKTLVFIRI